MGIQASPPAPKPAGKAVHTTAVLVQRPRSSEDRLLPPLRGTGAQVPTAGYKFKPTHAVILTCLVAGALTNPVFTRAPLDQCLYRS